eukprot:c5014_g1_i1 orf=3-194(-)
MEEKVVMRLRPEACSGRSSHGAKGRRSKNTERIKCNVHNINDVHYRVYNVGGYTVTRQTLPATR